MSFVAAAIGGAALIGAGASVYAANKQSDAAEAGGKLSGAAYTDAAAKLKPFVTGGKLANDQLLQLLGLGNPGGEDNPAYRDTYDRLFQAYDAKHRGMYGVGLYDSSVDPAARERVLEGFRKQAEQAANTSTNGNLPADFGSLVKPFTGDDLTSEPGYLFGMSEGEKAIDRIASAGSGRNSGATLKALARFTQDYAGTKFDSAFNRDAASKGQRYNFLMGESNLGENAATTTGANGINAANTQAGMLASGATAGASGVVGATNAVTGGVNTGVNYMQSQTLLDAIRGGRGSSGVKPFTMDNRETAGV